MFVTYALAVGLSLACTGLYQEVSYYRKWSVAMRWWGSLAVALVTFALVTLIAPQISHLALAATCSCAVFALSLCRNTTYEEQEQAPEPIAQEDPQDKPTEAVAVEDPVVEELVVEELVVEEPMAEEPVLVEEPVMDVSPEWLNEKIAEGYIAKAMGDFCGAVRAFEDARACCVEASLSAMLDDEIADCYKQDTSEELKQGA